VSVRRLGKDQQQVLAMAAGVAALAQEGVPPDLKRGLT